MAKTHAERIQELTDVLTEANVKIQILLAQIAAQEKEIARGARLDDEFIAKQAATEERLASLQVEMSTFRADLRTVLDRLAVSEAKNAALEVRARHQEKTSDRGWQLWIAILGFSFGLIS